MRGMSRCKRGEKDGVTTDPINDAGDCALNRLSQIHTRFRQSHRISRACIILIHNKGDIKDLKTKGQSVNFQ